MNEVADKYYAGARVWNPQLIKGMINVMAGLSQMGNNEIKIKSITTGSSPVESINDLLGDPDADVFGVQINCMKSVQQQLIIVCQLSTIFKVLAMAKDKFAESILDNDFSRQAALAEVGYVIGKSFLYSILNINNQGFNAFQTTILIDKVKQISALMTSDSMHTRKDVFFTDTTIVAKNDALRTVFLINGTRELLPFTIQGQG
jgi:hypothetical protein